MAPFNSNEEDATFYSPTLNMRLTYSQKNSYLEQGGYTLIFNPSINYTYEIIMGLYKDGFLSKQTNSVVLDFLMANPLTNNDLNYVKVIFEFDSAGNLVTEKQVSTLSRNRLQTSNEKLVVALLIILAICFFVFAIILFKNIKATLNGYDSWYSLFVKNSLPEAMMYHRERKKPEILRKMSVLFTVKLYFELFYVIFNTLFYACYMIYMVSVLNLESSVVLLGMKLDNIDNFDYLNLKHETYIRDNKDRLATIISKIEGIVVFKEMAAVFASFTVFCLSFELIFYLCNHSRFNKLLLSILKSLKELPYVFLLFVALIIAFATSAYLFIGQYKDHYRSLMLCSMNLLQAIYRLEDMDFMMVPDMVPVTLFITVILPYVFIVKFLVLNLFLSIIFRSYEASKSNKVGTKKEASVGFKRFFKITLSFFKVPENNNKNSKNFEIYLQTINKNNFNTVFDKFRESIESANKNTSVHIWANICAGEIKSEQEARNNLRNKCEEISQEYYLNSFRGNMSYFKDINKNVERKLIEYQLRHKYWNYMYTGHVKLNAYYQYFLNKMDYLSSRLNMDRVMTEQMDEEIIQKKEEKITKVYIKDLEMKLEANLKDLRVLTKSHEKLLKIQESFKEKLIENERGRVQSKSKRTEITKQRSKH